MTIAREEIFGPVLCILGYDDLDHAVEIANDTEYGLAGFVSGADLDKAREVARKIRAGWVTINHAFDMNAPFGGYKRSGNGREWSEFGFHEYLEVKSTLGYALTRPNNLGRNPYARQRKTGACLHRIRRRRL